jgi:hypothetical protein
MAKRDFATDGDVQCRHVSTPRCPQVTRCYRRRGNKLYIYLSTRGETLMSPIAKSTTPFIAFAKEKDNFSAPALLNALRPHR